MAGGDPPPVAIDGGLIPLPLPWVGFILGGPEVGMSEDQDKRQEAMEWVGKAYQLHMKGEIEKAVSLYTKSLEIHPTAEAFEFRGWARSF